MLMFLCSRCNLHMLLTCVLKLMQLHCNDLLCGGSSLCWWMWIVVQCREWKFIMGVLRGMQRFGGINHFLCPNVFMRQQRRGKVPLKCFSFCSFRPAAVWAHSPNITRTKNSQWSWNPIDVYIIFQIRGHFHCKLSLILEGQPQSAEFTWFLFALLSYRPFYPGQAEAAEHRALLQDWDQQPDGLQLSRCFPGQR